MPGPVQLKSVGFGDVVYALYPDVSLIWLNDFTATVNTPWISAELRVRRSTEQCLGRRRFIEQLSAHLIDLPIVAIHPTSGGAQAGPLQHVCDGSPVAACRTLPSAPEGTGRRNIFCCGQRLLELAEAAKVSNQISAVCAFTALRLNVCRSLEVGSDEKDLRLDDIRHCLQQSYYYTSHSVEALSIGLASGFPRRFCALLQEYIQQEQGHHRLVEQALEALGDVPDSRRVGVFTKYAMDLLSWSAKNNAFALANCLAYFEMGGYLDRDPIADALVRLGNSIAAGPVAAHFEINKRLGHANIGLCLADSLGIVDLNDLFTTAHLIESLSFALEMSVTDRRGNPK